jgi:PKD repeat protein
MSEEKPTGVKSTVGGWIKAGVTSIVGLVSGAVIMYLTPVVNNAIKPAKPVANFATQATGLSVQFNNRSTGGTQGWWDFGDGTALEPFDPKLDIVKHTYAKPGTYTVKLSLENLLGDDSDRSAPVEIAADSVPSPVIEVMQLVPIDSRQRAPCTYEFVSQVKNANVAILSLGDERATEVMESTPSQKRFVTFNRPGAFTVRLACVNGKQLVEKTQTVNVGANDVGDTMAKLLVTYDVVTVTRAEHTMRVFCHWPANAKESVLPFRKEHIAERGGATITKAELINANDPNAPGKLKVEISPDKSKVILSGEMVKATAATKPWVAQIKTELETRSAPQKINRGDVTMAVTVGTPMKIPMQPMDAGWEVIGKQVSLQLWDGQRKVWEGSQAVAGAPVVMGNKACYVTMTPQSDGMQLSIDTTRVTPVLPVSRPK